MTTLSRPAPPPPASSIATALRPGWRLRGEDVVGLLGANLVLIVAMWVRHGGLDQLGSTAGTAIAIGQVTECGVVAGRAGRRSMTARVTTP